MNNSCFCHRICLQRRVILDYFRFNTKQKGYMKQWFYNTQRLRNLWASVIEHPSRRAITVNMNNGSWKPTKQSFVHVSKLIDIMKFTTFRNLYNPRLWPGLRTSLYDETKHSTSLQHDLRHSKHLGLKMSNQNDNKDNTRNQPAPVDDDITKTGDGGSSDATHDSTGRDGIHPDNYSDSSQDSSTADPSPYTPWGSGGDTFMGYSGTKHWERREGTRRLVEGLDIMV